MTDRYTEIWALYRDHKKVEAVAKAEAGWPAMTDNPVASDAEVCRLVFVSCMDLACVDPVRVNLERLKEADVWWERALRLSFETGNWNCLAALMLNLQFLSVLQERKIAGEEVPHRPYLLHDRIMAIMREMIRALDRTPPGSVAENNVPLRGVLHRLYHEKQGFSLYRRRRFAEALTEYEAAYEASKSEHPGQQEVERAKHKVRGGLLLCRYQLAPDSESRDRVVADGELLESECQGEAHLTGTRKKTRWNLDAMKRARTEDRVAELSELKVYEVE